MNMGQNLVGAIVLAGVIALSVAPASAAPAKRCQSTRRFDQTWYVKIDTSNDGGTCAIGMSYDARTKSGTSRMVPTSGSVTSEPQHGKVNLVFDPLTPKIEYTPAAGYVGADHFEIRYGIGAYQWLFDVTVAP